MALNKKKRPRRPPNKHARLVESRAKAIEKKIANILNQMVGKMLAVVIEEIRDYGTISRTPRARKPRRQKTQKSVRGPIRKTLTLDELDELAMMLETVEERDLLKLLTRFGLVQVAAAGTLHTLKPAPGMKPSQFVIKPTFETDYVKKNIVLIQQLRKSIEQTFREGVAAALGEWMAEEPRPMVREISRRLRTHHFLPKEMWTDADKGLLKPLKNSTSIVGLANRSMTIARTEVARARNAGNTEGMMQAGFTHHTWVTTFDEFTREGHGIMDSVTVRLDEPFVTPDGNLLMFPCDPSGAPSEVINCRCETIPAIVDQKT